MALETATTIFDLVATNPPGGDSRRQGDDHIRLIKATLAATFLKGTAGARPAAGTAGRYYQATDTGVLSWDDGTNWVAAGATKLLSLKQADYEVTAADCAGASEVIVPYDLSGAERTLKLEAAAGYTKITAVLVTDPASYQLVITDSADVELIRLGIQGQRCTYGSDGTNERLLGITPYNEVYVRYTAATDGAGLTANSNNTLTLDEEVRDTGNNSAVSTNQVTLAAGKYRVKRCVANVNFTGGAPAEGILQLVNTTTGPTALTTAQDRIVGGNDTTLQFSGEDVLFDVAAGQALEMQFWLQIGDTAHELEYSATMPVSGGNCIGNELVLERIQ